MRTFKSVRNEQTAELINMQDEQVTLKMADGKEKTISKATLKRWWKEIEEPQIEEAPISIDPIEKTSTITLTDTEHDIEESIPEIKDTKKKVKSEKQKKEPSPLKKVIEDIAHDLETEITTATIETFKSLKVHGKRYAAFTFDNKSVTLWLYSDAIRGKILGLTNCRKINHILDIRVKFENDDPDAVKRITELLEASALYISKKELERQAKKLK